MWLTLTKKQQIDEDIYLFTFQPEEPVTWKSGQQMVFTLEHPEPDNLGMSRILSIASAPFEHTIQILTHCNSESSSFKKTLNQMEIGGRIHALKPQGDFIIHDPKKEYTFIAAGVGIAPFRAMLADMDFHNFSIRITLLYSHTNKHFPFKDELEELTDRHPEFQIFYTVSPEDKERGRIKEVVSGLPDHLIYMSGIYVRKIAQMLDGTVKKPRKLVHDGSPTRLGKRQQEIEDEQNCLIQLLGE